MALRAEHATRLAAAPDQVTKFVHRERAGTKQGRGTQPESAAPDSTSVHLHR